MTILQKVTKIDHKYKIPPWDKLTPAIDAIATNGDTGRMIGHMRGINRMTAHTIMILHAKTARIEINTEMTNLVKMIGNTPRPLMARTARVDTMLTM